METSYHTQPIVTETCETSSDRDTMQTCRCKIRYSLPDGHSFTDQNRAMAAAQGRTHERNATNTQSDYTL